MLKELVFLGFASCLNPSLKTELITANVKSWSTILKHNQSSYQRSVVVVCNAATSHVCLNKN